MAEILSFKVKANWGALKGGLGPALDAIRQDLLEELENEIRSKAPESLKSKVRRTQAGVVVDDPRAPAIEFGSSPHWAPISDLLAWAASKGKERDAAYRIQRSIAARGTPERPFFRPAVAEFLNRFDAATSGAWARHFKAGIL